MSFSGNNHVMDNEEAEELESDDDGRFSFDPSTLSHWSTRGRKKLVRDIPEDITPTTFEDEPEEDDNGEEIPIELNGLFAGQDFAQLRSKCLNRGKRFVDPIFPPSPTSVSLKGDEKYSRVKWIRASQLVRNPRFVVEGATRFDINQGRLGDCWFLAAVANLTLHKTFFEHVVPTDQGFTENYVGIFHFRFWRFGDWIDVVVDDYLPTVDGRLVFLRSDTGNEFWSSLLEKAYAKVHGSYEALAGGYPTEAMVDFTGGIGEQYGMKQVPGNIFNILLKAYQRESMMSCAIRANANILEEKLPSGLVRGHAYSITKVIRAEVDNGEGKQSVPLIRIRNPWGNSSEWTGSWSDRSAQWQSVPPDQRRAMGLTFDHDGEFYMSAKDFVQNWEWLELCHVTMEWATADSQRISWSSTLKEGVWIEGQSAGGCRNNETFAMNPQFGVVLRDSDDDDELCTCVVSVMQKESRRRKAVGGKGKIAIGFAMFRLDEDEDLPLNLAFFRSHSCIARSRKFSYRREVSGRFKLPPGRYVLVPSTFHPGDEGEFIVRVFTEKPADLGSG